VVKLAEFEIPGIGAPIGAAAHGFRFNEPDFPDLTGRLGRADLNELDWHDDHAPLARIKRHPDSKRTTLFVSSSTTSHLIGPSEERNMQVLDDTFGHAYQPWSVYVREWRQDHFIVWDDVGLQHCPKALLPHMKRTLFRFTGIAEQWQGFR
jgi:alpha-ketoglutarate-dependent taurine dioxygenase